MSIAIAALILSIAGLVILYLVRPYYQPGSPSFGDYVPHEKQQPPPSRFKLTRLFKSLLFWIQLFMLVLALLALLLADRQLNAPSPQERIGVWVVLDTSASMSTQQSGQTRLAIAHAEIARLAAHLDQVKASETPCVRLSTFDMDVNDIFLSGTTGQLITALNTLEVRPLGTEVNRLRSILARAAEPSACPITHVVVVTDTSFPTWIETPEADDNPIQVIWLDIGIPVDNIGFVDVRRTSLILGANNEVEAELAGGTSGQSQVTVTDAAGQEIASQTVDWQGKSTQRLTFELPGSGQFTFKLDEGGAYTFDDQVTIDFNDQVKIRVDWQLADTSLLKLLNWTPDTVSPHVRVVSYPAPTRPPIATLLVGSGYNMNTASQVSYFVESPLLNGLNFDVAEQLGIAGISLPDGSGLMPVLYDTRNLTWFAVDESQPAAYVPGLPVFTGDENLRAFSTTAFFNALNWLLRAYTPPALYTLTSPEQPVIEGSLNALHSNEGFTEPPASWGEIGTIAEHKAANDDFPLWLILITLAAVTFGVERTLALYRIVR